ncbi:DUF6342 family protein [Nocardia sp. NPDC003693]
MLRCNRIGSRCGPREIVARRIFFTTHHGPQKKIIAILDSNGDLYIAGRVIAGQTDLKYA